jgi:hypothetical protein
MKLHPQMPAPGSAGPARRLRDDEEAASSAAIAVGGVTVTLTGLLAWLFGGAFMMSMNDPAIASVGFLTIVGVGVALYVKWGR